MKRVNMSLATSRKTVTLDESTPHDTDKYLCGPCDVENKTNNAVGYCQYCRHYLCTTCFGYHRNLGKIHTLLNHDAMPKATPEYKLLSDPCIETCKDHKHKPIELYCKTHDEVCCVICVTLHHKKCDYVYIPDVTESTDNTAVNDSPYILKMIQALIRQFESSVTELTNRTKELDRKKKEFGSSVRKLKKEINECLDNLERQATNEMRQTYENETKLITDNITKCEEAMKSLSATFTRTKAVISTDKPNKIFTVSKISQKQMRDLEACLKTVHNNTFQVELKFEPNLEIMRSLTKCKHFGKIVHKRAIIKVPPPSTSSVKDPPNGENTEEQSTDSSQKGLK